MRHPLRARASRRGSAITLAIVLTTVLSALVLGLLATTVDASRLTSQQADELSVESAAESAMSLAVDRLWGGFQRETAGKSARIWDFRFYLDGLGLADGDSIDLADQLGLPTNAGRPVVSDAVVAELRVRRVDEFASTRLEVSATVESDRGANEAGTAHVLRQTLQSAWAVGAADWEGLDYALLANNVNCILCHTQVDSAKRYYNRDTDRYGESQRVKLGSIESFHVRSDPDSTIAGTLYLGGDALTSDGHPIDDWAALSLESRVFDMDGFLQEDAWGGLFPTKLSPASAVDPQPKENLYTDYLAADVEQVDGYLPESFPSPFPDDGGYDLDAGRPAPENAGNRVVDDTEFAVVAAAASGTVSGGTIAVIGPGQTVTKSKQLEALLSGNVGGLHGVAQGSVYLHGTPDDPIVLNGDLAIDGDLVLHGTVKGSGALKVRGNVFVLDDVGYADGESAGARSYGVAADGMANALAIVSGGNIVLGDAFRAAWGEGVDATGDTEGSYNFILEEMGIFNRMEWMKTQPTLPGEPVQVKVGEEWYDKKVQPKKKETYLDQKKVYAWVPTGKKIKKPIYKWVTVPSDKPGDYGEPQKVKQLVGWKTVDEKKKVFVGYQDVWRTRWVNDGPPYWVKEKKDLYEWQSDQHPNPYYEGPDYVPRYYALTQGGAVPVFNKAGWFDPQTHLWQGPERAEDWDTDKLTIADPGDPADPLLFDADGSPKAVVSTVTPSTGWISDDMLRKLVRDQLEARSVDAFEVDATLYSNNSIFGMIPERSSPGTDGRLIVNGGIVAADVGLLAPRGVRINYDERGKELIRIDDDSRLSIERVLWAPARP